MIRSRRARPPTSARSNADRCGCHRQQARPFCAGGRRAARPNTVPPRLARLRVRFSFARPSTHRSPGPPRLVAPALHASLPRPDDDATALVSTRDKCGFTMRQVRMQTATGAVSNDDRRKCDRFRRGKAAARPFSTVGSEGCQIGCRTSWTLSVSERGASCRSR